MAKSLAERIEALWTLNDTENRKRKAEILADVRELERDAARYRWLRSLDTGPRELDQSLFETINDDCHPPYRSMKHSADLDAAIDAAISKTKGST